MMKMANHHSLFWICSVLLMWLSLSSGSRHEYVEELDPFDILNFDPAAVRMKEDTRVNVPKPDVRRENKEQQIDSAHADPARDGAKETTPPATESCGSLSVLFKQYLMQLVKHLEPHVDSSSGSGYVFSRIAVSPRDLDKFREYNESEASNIHEVHESLSHMLQDVHRMSAFDTRLFWLEEKLGMSAESLRQVAIIVTTGAIICSSLILFLRMMPRIGVKSIVLIIFFISVVFTWFEMFQKEQANQEKILSENLATHCPSLAGLPWYERLGTYVSSTFTFQDESCKEFYQATIVNPMFKINPLEVCAVVLVKTVTTPLDIIGSGIKRFLIGLLKDLPLLYQTYVMTFLAVLVVLLPFLACGYRVRVPFLFSIEPCPSPQVQNANAMLGRGESTSKHDAIDGIDTLPDRMAALSISAPEEKLQSMTCNKSLKPSVSRTPYVNESFRQAPDEDKTSKKSNSETTSSKAKVIIEEEFSTPVSPAPPRHSSPSKNSSEITSSTPVFQASPKDLSPKKPSSGITLSETTVIDTKEVSKSDCQNLPKEWRSLKATSSKLVDLITDVIKETGCKVPQEDLSCEQSVSVTSLSENVVPPEETPSSSSDTVKEKYEMNTSIVQSLETLEDNISDNRVSSSDGSLQSSAHIKDVQPLENDAESKKDSETKQEADCIDSFIVVSGEGEEQGQGDADSNVDGGGLTLANLTFRDLELSTEVCRLGELGSTLKSKRGLI